MSPRRPGTPRELRRFLNRLGGGRLVYGRPVRAGDRAVIPVSRVRLAGGFGFGMQADDEGGGGGGIVQARPAGFIEVGPEGARYQAIPRERGRLAGLIVAVSAGALAGSAVAGTAVSARALKRLARAGLPRARRAARWSSTRAQLPSLRRSLRR